MGPGAALAEATWVAAPLILGGAVHIAVIKTGALGRLGRLALDGGTTFRGRRVFGENKTVRGVVVMVAATIAFAALEGALATAWPAAGELSVTAVSRARPVAWGALLGLGYVAGELPNSFLKRQLDIAPGGRGPGALGIVFWLVDQLDSLAGVLALVGWLWTPRAEVVLALVVLALSVHPAVALVMVRLRLKQRVG